MSRSAVNNPAVVFFARLNGYKYPTFTITVHSGPYFPRSSRSHNYEIVQGYQNVGFTDARVLDTTDSSFRFMAKKRHGVLVGYSLNGQKLIAEVSYVSAENQHFILTYVDTAVNFARNAVLRQSVSNSFTISRTLLARNQRGGSYPGVSLAGTDYDYGNRYYADRYGQITNASRWFNVGNSPPLLAPILLIIIVIFGAATLFRSDTK
jgi:hypothetical protein